ncbi:MAG: cation:proton antiporter [Bacteroidales bacterium]|nr:cation:proton antiporter [Bacteroidales bacterium]
MAYQNLFIFSLFILFYALFATRIDKTMISGPVLALIVGLIFGPLVLDLMHVKLESEEYRIIAELALALVLFTDASKTNLMVLKKNAGLPIRLLLIGLPLTIIFGMIAGFMIFNGFSWIELGILATMLAPTDAALGKAVVTNQAVPSKIREALNIESGLNDGISVPVLFLFIAFFDANQSGNGLESFYGLLLLIKVIGIGLITGLVITLTMVLIIHFSKAHKWISESWKPILIIALSFSCFTAAQIAGGSGFIACFAGGFLYGTLSSKYKPGNNAVESAEGAGDTMSLLTWLMFGAFVIAKFLPEITWEATFYALLSLTVIRMGSVYLSLIKTGISKKSKLFIGWFGPRGLATIVFAIIVLDVPLPNKDTIAITTVCAILLSVVLHGITANPFIKLLNKK